MRSCRALPGDTMTVRSPIQLLLTVALAGIVGACSVATAPTGSPPSSSSPSTAPHSSGSASSPSPSASSSTSPSPSASASASTSPSPSAAAATLLLKVTSEGGFIGPTATLAALPSVVVYTDGRIFTPAAQDAMYPGALLPALQVRDVGPAGAAAITAAIRDVHLDSPAPSENPVGADMGTTVITAVLDGVTTTARFTGLGGAPGRPNSDGGNATAAAAKALLDRLDDPSDDWGGTAGPQTLYTPAGHPLFVAPRGPPSH